MARLSVSTRSNDKKELSRKELLKRDDAFLSAAADSAVWAERNKMQLLVGIGVLAIAVIGVVAYDAVSASKGEKAAEALQRATLLENAKVVTADEKADPNAAEPTFASTRERDQAARDAYVKVREASSGKGEQLARLMVASFDVKLGEKEAAEKELKSLIDAMGADDSLFFLAVERLAYLQEARGDLASAISTLERLKDKAFYADRAQLRIARLQIAQGDTAKARATLEKVKSEHEKSAVATEAGELLASLGGAAPAKAE